MRRRAAGRDDSEARWDKMLGRCRSVQLTDRCQQRHRLRTQQQQQQQQQQWWGFFKLLEQIG